MRTVVVCGAYSATGGRSRGVGVAAADELQMPAYKCTWGVPEQCAQEGACHAQAARPFCLDLRSVSVSFHACA